MVVYRFVRALLARMGPAFIVDANDMEDQNYSCDTCGAVSAFTCLCLHGTLLLLPSVDDRHENTGFRELQEFPLNLLYWIISLCLSSRNAPKRGRESELDMGYADSGASGGSTSTNTDDEDGGDRPGNNQS